MDDGWCYNCLREECAGCTPTRPQDDDGSEWSPEPFLDYIGSEPITIEKLMDYLDMYPEVNREVPVEEVLKRMRESRA